MLLQMAIFIYPAYLNKNRHFSQKYCRFRNLLRWVKLIFKHTHTHANLFIFHISSIILCKACSLAVMGILGIRQQQFGQCFWSRLKNLNTYSTHCHKIWKGPWCSLDNNVFNEPLVVHEAPPAGQDFLLFSASGLCKTQLSKIVTQLF